MKNKRVLITGATSGIGKETALALASAGAAVIFTSRDPEKGEKVKQEIIDTSGNRDVHMIPCDFSSLSSVKTCCDTFLSTYDRLDILINNAGTWDFHRRESQDGIENNFATNYLAPFLMTNLLLDRLRASRPSRIISVVSGLHWGRMQFHDLEFNKESSGFRTYRQSKLALLLFTRLLALKLRNDGVTVNCADPGMVATDLGRDAGAFSRFIFRTFGRSPKQGAETTVFLASADDVQHITGECFSGIKIARTSKESRDLASARTLWDISMRYVQGYLSKA